MINTREIKPVQGFDATLQLPGSKSITNRAILIAALGDGPAKVDGALRSADTEAFVAAINNIGASAVWKDTTVVIEQPIPAQPSGQIYTADAGTAARFLPPAVAALNGRVDFDGSEQMRKRPMLDLLNALRTLGTITNPPDSSVLPFSLDGTSFDPASLELPGNISSQYLSGMLMALPVASKHTLITVPSLISKPYIDLTISMMEDYGATVERDEYRSFTVQPTGRYKTAGKAIAVEADASTASYFFAAAVATGSRITVTNLRRSTLQGDAKLLDVFEQMGATVIDDARGITVEGPAELRGIDIDMGDISDVMMTLACVAPLATSPTTITNVPHARVKESDRIDAVVKGLTCLGIRTDEGPDWLRIYPGPSVAGSIDTRDDHRIAMSFSVLGLARPGVTIENPGCTAKTAPSFFTLWRQLEDGGGALRRG